MQPRHAPYPLPVHATHPCGGPACGSYRLPVCATHTNACLPGMRRQMPVRDRRGKFLNNYSHADLRQNRSAAGRILSTLLFCHPGRRPDRAKYCDRRRLFCIFRCARHSGPGLRLHNRWHTNRRSRIPPGSWLRILAWQTGPSVPGQFEYSFRSPSRRPKRSRFRIRFDSSVTAFQILYQ